MKSLEFAGRPPWGLSLLGPLQGQGLFTGHSFACIIALPRGVAGLKVHAASDGFPFNLPVRHRH